MKSIASGEGMCQNPEVVIMTLMIYTEAKIVIYVGFMKFLECKLLEIRDLVVFVRTFLSLLYIISKILCKFADNFEIQL